MQEAEKAGDSETLPRTHIRGYPIAGGSLAMPHLVVRMPGRLPFSLPLTETLSIGRHAENGLVLDDAQVSRKHATFSSVGGVWEVLDLASRHGTLVNGERISSRRLLDGDHIQVGHVLLDYREAAEPHQIVFQQATEADAPLRDERADERLKLLYDVSHAIGEVDDIGAMVARLLEAVLRLLSCERALLALGSLEQGILRRYEQTRGKGVGEIVLSHAVLEATLGRRQSLVMRDAALESRSNTMMDEQIRSAMAVPLSLGDKLLGLLYVDDRREAARFSPQDLQFLTALSRMLAAALESAERLHRAETLVEVFDSAQPTAEIVGQSQAIMQLKAQILKYAPAVHAHVLIRGESGTGKELVARALHKASPRQRLPFVTLNCAAIPETMIESELFGYEKGSFTGAVKAKRGKFALADGGTLFLDEIGDLGAAAQAKLLRAIQEGEVQPLGSERTLKVDVRIVSATHKDLREEIRAGRFREDLFYRLNIIEIEVPPLRERKGDMPLLVARLLEKAQEHIGKRFVGLSPVAMAALEKHDWPGNVRELRNEMERAVINAESNVIEAYDLSPRLGAARPRPSQPRGRSLAEQFAELEPTEKVLVEQALAEARGNISEAARLLGITRIMIKRRMEKFGLSAKDEG